MSSENATLVSAPPSRSSSTSFEQSPAIAEVLRQIASAKTSVAELRTQLAESQTAASQSRFVLQQEVDAHREKKKQEDVSKADLKTRTKNLEDAKRHAEGLKKEADKKLKVAQTTRDDVTRRMELVNDKIVQLQAQLAQDVEFISSRKNQVVGEERDIPNSIEQKRQEIKVAEDEVHAFNQRSRGLEEKLSSRRERLRILRDKIEQYNERRSTAGFNQRQHFYQQLQDPWLVGVDDAGQPLVSPVQQDERLWNTQLDFMNAQLPSPSTISSVSLEDHVTAPNGKGFSESSLFNGHANGIHHKSVTTQGYFTPDFVPIGHGTVFEEDNNISRSFKSDSDPYLDRDFWRVSHANGNLDGSTLTTASTDDVHVSPSSRPDYKNGPYSLPTKHVDSTNKPRLRSSTLSSKGLNPDAKEFNFFPSSNTFSGSGSLHSSVASKSTPPTYDVLNPSGCPSTTTTSQQSLLRAFALSPEEREALQRTLGGPSNRSFERLLSLSDVGSISSSPSGGDFGSRLPVWLQALPRNRKANFSPWDDEEPQVNSRKS